MLLQFPGARVYWNGLEVNAPTGHKSMTLPDISDSMARST